MSPSRRVGPSGGAVALSVLSLCRVVLAAALFAVWAGPEVLAAVPAAPEWDVAAIGAAERASAGAVAAEIAPFTIREIALALALVVVAGIVALIVIDSGAGRRSRPHL